MDGRIVGRGVDVDGAGGGDALEVGFVDGGGEAACALGGCGGS